MPLPIAYFASKRPRDVDVSLESYIDSDFANCIDDRQFISGICVLSDRNFYQMAVEVSIYSSPEHYGGRVYCSSYGYTEGLLFTITTGGDETECKDSECTEGGP